MTFQELIKSKGFTAYRLSKESGVSLTTVHSLARGERSFDKLILQNALSLSETLGLSIEEIIQLLKKDPLV